MKLCHYFLDDKMRIEIAARTKEVAIREHDFSAETRHQMFLHSKQIEPMVIDIATLGCEEIVCLVIVLHLLLEGNLVYSSLIYRQFLVSDLGKIVYWQGAYLVKG